VKIRLDLLAWTAAAAMATIPITALAAVDSFIWFEGEQGNAADARHKGWFEIKELSLGAEAQTGMSASSGAGAGKVRHGEFTVKRVSDSASPKLFQHAMTTGRHFPVVKIEMRKAGGDPHQFMTYTFTDVMISRMNMGGAGDRGPEESITFVYGGMKVEYSNQAAGGPTATAPVKALTPPTRSAPPPR
jgi:type VI secretion system secreted protein Hcp